VSGQRILATFLRVLRQLRHDPRTVALLMLVPLVLMTLLRYVYDTRPMIFNRIAPPLLALFPFVIMFIVTSVAMLRERTSGTLERLLTTPLAKLDLLLGYALAFGALAAVQVGFASGLAFWLLGLETVGSPWLLLLFAVIDAVMGMALGLFVSAFANTEFQAVQFMPAFVFPQFLLCGLLAPRDSMQPVLHWLSDVMPLSYAVDGVTRVATSTGWSQALVLDLVVVVLCVPAALTLGAATLRRRTP
jgi:ABC-2 type transport system permease protein